MNTIETKIHIKEAQSVYLYDGTENIEISHAMFHFIRGRTDILANLYFEGLWSWATTENFHILLQNTDSPVSIACQLDSTHQDIPLRSVSHLALKVSDPIEADKLRGYVKSFVL